jgi:tRNA threonylcarbamoyladenosine biosynthesis protein TsaB
MEAGHPLSDVDLFAVASGPGSFTGLRIGVATVKAFAATLKRPSIGVPTLHAVALSAGVSQGTLAMIPAGRGEVFGQLLKVEPEGSVRPLSEPAHLPPKDLLARLGLERRLKLAGEAVALYAEEINAYARQQGIILEREGEERSFAESDEDRWTLQPTCENLALHVAAEALRLFKSGAAGSPDELRAIYVRPSDAELNEQCREQNKLDG